MIKASRINGTQVEMLQKYMEVQPYVTQLIARQVLGIERLASRIHDLKKLGFPIDKETCEDMAGSRYVRYSFNRSLMAL